jgi:hypothetical protein
VHRERLLRLAEDGTLVKLVTRDAAYEVVAYVFCAATCDQRGLEARSRPRGLGCRNDAAQKDHAS